MVARTSSPLGKGLKALLPIMEEDNGIYGSGLADNSPKKDSPYFICPINFIEPNPYQPRKSMDKTPLEGLSASIKEKGILQPLVVRKVSENKYELIAGERRLQASKLAGLEKVPVIVREIAMSDRLELALIENIQRENLNPVDEAEAYAQLMQEFGLTQESVAKRVGKERSTVANSIRLLQLPDDVKADLANGAIKSGHARVLLSLGDHEQMRSMRDEIVKNKLSVRETEALVKKAKKQLSAPRPKQPPKMAIPDEYCRSLTNGLVNYLGSKAKISQNGERGKIEIEYYSIDDLDRVMGLIISEQA